MTGPCAKQTVTATIISPDGLRFVGTNAVARPQPSCPRRGMPTGVGYELCDTVCQQAGHAEVQALRKAGNSARGSILYLEGHTYACEPCKAAVTAAGIVEIVIASPPSDRETGRQAK